jgi:hypothetical protein
MDRDWIRSEIEKIFENVPREVPRIRSLRLISFELSPSPPIITEISLETCSKTNDVVFRLRYQPDLICHVSLGVPVPLLTEIQISAHLIFSSFDGAFRLFVPPQHGPMQLRVLSTTAIDCSFGLELGSTLKMTQAADLAPLWAALLDWIHRFVHAKVITIPLEQKIPVPDSRPKSPPKPRVKKKQRRMVPSEPEAPRVTVRRHFEFYQEIF